MENKKRLKKIIVKIVAAVLAASFIFYIGYGYGKKSEAQYVPPASVSGAASGQGTVDFSIFWQTWNKLCSLYLGNCDTQKMVYGAAQGMVASLGDPYTEFLDPTDYQALSTQLSGSFSGIGAELSTNSSGQIIVIAPLAGSPAEKAGLKAKDAILSIDGTSTQNLTVDQAVDKIRGQAGTEVKLEILHSGSTTPVTISITRSNITVPSVTYKLLNLSGKKVALISVAQFGDDTTALATKYTSQAKSDGAVGIIIDLRNNPGGYLDGAISFSSLFLPKGDTVVSEVDKNGQKQVYKVESAPLIPNLPLTVLVNGGSASAAEIVTGALKENGRAEIVGEKTFGKGVVQEVEPLSAGSALKVTVAKWLTPKNNEIQGKGITPDITVAAGNDLSTDLQLEKAESELLLKIK